MIRFITYVGSWKGATVEGFAFVKGEYLGVPARIAERILRNPDFQERPAEPSAPVAPVEAPPLVAEPVVDETPEPPMPPTLLDLDPNS